MRHGIKGVKTYDFEACDNYLGEKFLQTLRMFHITPVEYNVEPYYGSWVRFLATDKERLRIEYVFRHLVGFGRADHLRKGVSTLEMWKAYGGDIYAIY